MTATHLWELRAPEYLETQISREGALDEFRVPDSWWLSETPIDGQFGVLLVRARRTVAKPPDFFYHGVLPFVSDRCKRIVESIGGFRGEFHPAKLLGSDGREFGGNPYWYLRLFTRVDGVDKEASQIEYFPGTARPRRIWQLRLNRPAFVDVNLFRLEKVESIFASDTLKSALEIEGLSIRFSPAEDFRLGW